jgi:hypothetical protein
MGWKEELARVQSAYREQVHVVIDRERLARLRSEQLEAAALDDMQADFDRYLWSTEEPANWDKLKA